MARRLSIPLVLGAVLGAVGLLLVFSATARAAAQCHKVAAPGGSDKAEGTARSPYGTIAKLAGSLHPGQTGCLRGGVYREQNVTVARGGTAGARITIRSYPGERATHVGRLFIKDSANHVTVSGLNLDGSGAPSCSGGTCRLLPSPVVSGDHVHFIANDVTNRNTAICFNLGSGDYGRAIGTLIRNNRIHHCGRLPATNHDHGVYLQAADDTRIIDNLIFANADRGVQMYPDAQRTLVADNVIDGNGTGVQFSGNGGVASNHNVVERNLITNSTLHNVATWYPDGGPVGAGNVVRGGCISGGGKGDVSVSSVLIAATTKVGSPCPRVAISDSATARRGKRLRVAGWAPGVQPGRARLTIKARSGKGWVKVGRVGVAGSQRFTKALAIRKLRKRAGAKRTLRLRAVARGAGASQPIVARVG